MWYRREEQPLRHGIWFLGNAIATMFGGLLAYGIAHIGGYLQTWRVSLLHLLMISTNSLLVVALYHLWPTYPCLGHRAHHLPP